MYIFNELKRCVGKDLWFESKNELYWYKPLEYFIDDNGNPTIKYIEMYKYTSAHVYKEHGRWWHEEDSIHTIGLDNIPELDIKIPAEIISGEDLRESL